MLDLYFNLFIDFPQKLTELYNIYSIFDTKHTFTSYFTQRKIYKYRVNNVSMKDMYQVLFIKYAMLAFQFCNYFFPHLHKANV